MLCETFSSKWFPRWRVIFCIYASPIYFKVNNRNTVTRCGVRLKLTIINTSKRRQLIVIVLASLLLTLNIWHTLLFSVSILVAGYNLTRHRDARILYSSNICSSITLQSIGIHHSVYTLFFQFRKSNI